MVLAACGPAPEPEAPPAAVESAAPPPAAENGTATALGPLVAGETRRAVLEPGGAHLYRLDLEAGDALRLEADQDELDLQATILDPGGVERLVVDLPAGAWRRSVFASSPTRPAPTARGSSLRRGTRRLSDRDGAPPGV